MKNALLIIDVQQDFTGPAARMPVEQRQAQEMIKNLNNVVVEADALGLLVVYIGNEYPRFAALNIFRNFAAIRQTPGTALDSRLAVVTNHYFPKQRGNAFSNPALGQFLKNQGVETVILTGLYAEACVWHTLKGAQKVGFKTAVLPDAIATKTEAKRQTMLKRYEKQGALLLKTITEL